ncbi:hypothetical protein TNCV_348021 [Trichonephila clavipes]|nr:hypothetical protein TNCV_348021 [Trichonephila clavipes]
MTPVAIVALGWNETFSLGPEKSFGGKFENFYFVHTYMLTLPVYFASYKNRDPKDNVGNVNRDPKENVGQGGSGAYVASNGNRDPTGNVDQPTPPADVASYRNRDTKHNVGV